VTIGRNNLETIDPFVADAEKVDGDDIAGITCFNGAQDVVKRIDFAMFIELARAIMIPVIRADGEWHHRRQRGNAAHHYLLQPSSHEHSMLHAEAVSLLAAVCWAAVAR
jgi:hypothetical protein